MYVHRQTCMHIYVCMYINAHITHIHMNGSICVCMHVCVYIYAYIYVCRQTDIYSYTETPILDKNLYVLIYVHAFYMLYGCINLGTCIGRHA